MSYIPESIIELKLHQFSYNYNSVALTPIITAPSADGHTESQSGKCAHLVSAMMTYSASITMIIRVGNVYRIPALDMFHLIHFDDISTTILLTLLGGVPYPDLSNKVVVERVLAGYRMQRPINCSDEM